MVACQLMLGIDDHSSDAAVDAATDALGTDGPLGDGASDGDAVTIAPAVDIAAAPGAVAVALLHGDLYWSGLSGEAGAVFVAPEDGGQARPLSTGEPEVPNDLAPGSDRLYFARTQFCAQSLYAVSETTGLSSSLSAVPGCSVSVVRFAGNGRDFYGSLYGAEHPKIAHFVQDQTATLAITDANARYGAVTVTDQGDVVYVDESTGSIDRLVDGAPQRVAPAPRVTDIDNDAAYIYWITADGVVARYDKTSASVTALRTGLGPLQRLTVRRGILYVTEATPSLGSGRVLRIDRDGALTVLAEVPGEPFDIAVDDVRVVWSNRARGTITEARFR